jgi:hypothetical protein
VRILIQPKRPVFALLILAPTLPELLTGSTPISNLLFNPIQFVISFALDVGLYGAGALLIREFVVYYRKGWASVLLLGAAYGIAEEGFAVHTFFQTSGNPVGVLGSYGHAAGVDWLWALGLTVFHATYSIALPILLTELAYPAAKGVRWLDRSSVVVLAVVYLAVVLFAAFFVGHGPSLAALGFFLAVVAGLIVLAATVPADLIHLASRPSRIGRWGLWLAGSLEWDAWIAVLIVSSARIVPAAAAAAIIFGANGLAVAVVLGRVGWDNLERSKLRFATGMLVPLFLWDGFLEFRVPGILGVAFVVAVFLYWLDRQIDRRETVRKGSPLPLSPPAG